MSIRDTVLAAVTRAAEAGEPCPTNDQLANLCGFLSPSGGSTALSELEKLGLIKVQRGQASRVVTIVATGKRTAGKVPRPHWRHMTPDQRAECAERAKTPKPNPRANKKEFEVERALERQAYKERIERDAEANYVMREPCLRCGVRADKHLIHGCRRYTA